MAFITRPGTFNAIRRNTETARQFDVNTTIQQANQNIKTGLTTIQQIAEAMRAQGIDPSGPQGQKAMAPLLESMLSASAAVQHLGVDGVIAPEAITAVAQGAVMGPSREQSLKNAAEETETLATAQARGTAAGTPPAPRTSSIVVTGGSKLGESLGIPSGDKARVEITYAEDGVTPIKADVKGSFGSKGNTIIVGGERGTALEKELGKGRGERLNSLVEAGQFAAINEFNLRQMADALRSGVGTGRLQAATLALRGVAADLGVELGPLGEALRIDTRSVEEQEDFNRLARGVMIEGFRKFKGNLNSKEVEIAEEAFASMGGTEQANMRAVASMLAASQIARERAVEAASVTSDAEAASLEKEMIQSDPDRFLEFRDKFINEMTGKSGGKVEAVEIPEGSVAVGQKDGKTLWRTPDGAYIVEEPNP